jgi:hypothetical protein
MKRVVSGQSQPTIRIKEKGHGIDHGLLYAPLRRPISASSSSTRFCSASRFSRKIAIVCTSPALIASSLEIVDVLPELLR